MKVWPCNPGDRWRGGPYKTGTTAYASRCTVHIKYLQSSICTHRTVYSYILIHMIISAFGVFVNTFRLPDHIPWASTSRCEKKGPKQETSCCADWSDIGCCRSRRSHLLCNVLPGDGRGARQRLTVSARVAVHRTIKRCAVYVARNAKSKEAHLTCSNQIKF